MDGTSNDDGDFSSSYISEDAASSFRDNDEEDDEDEDEDEDDDEATSPINVDGSIDSEEQEGDRSEEDGGDTPSFPSTDDSDDDDEDDDDDDDDDGDEDEDGETQSPHSQDSRAHDSESSAQGIEPTLNSRRSRHGASTQERTQTPQPALASYDDDHNVSKARDPKSPLDVLTAVATREIGHLSDG